MEDEDDIHNNTTQPLLSESSRVNQDTTLVVLPSSAIIDEGGEGVTQASSVQLGAAEQQKCIQPQSSYIVKPTLKEKFKAAPIKEISQHVLYNFLKGKVYDSVEAKTWTIEIANCINEQIRELELKRYKHIVQVTIGEVRGAGVKYGIRCLWDSETDGYTHEIFMNDSIFAVVVVFAVYLY